MPVPTDVYHSSMMEIFDAFHQSRKQIADVPALASMVEHSASASSALRETQKTLADRATAELAEEAVVKPAAKKGQEVQVQALKKGWCMRWQPPAPGGIKILGLLPHPSSSRPSTGPAVQRPSNSSTFLQHSSHLRGSSCGRVHAQSVKCCLDLFGSLPSDRVSPQCAHFSFT